MDNQRLPHPLKAGSMFRLQLSGVYKPTGRILRIDREAGVFWFKLFEKPGVVFGPWCFSTFAGPVKKWKIVMTHHTPYPVEYQALGGQPPAEPTNKDWRTEVTDKGLQYFANPIDAARRRSGLSRKIVRAADASRKRFQKYTPADRKRLEANARARIAEGAAERGSLKGRRFGHLV